MIPHGVAVFVAVEPVDMRLYAEFGVMRSRARRRTTTAVQGHA